MSDEFQSRRYSNPPTADRDGFQAPVEKGGTYGDTSAAARAALGAVGTSDVNLPNGPMGLDGSGNASVGAFSDNTSVQGRNSVIGANKIITGTTQTYTITDYDAIQGYTLTTINGGTATRVGDTISYTAPQTAGTSGFILNGRRYEILIVIPGPDAPTITSPSNGATNVNPKLTLSASAFSLIAGAIGTHLNTDWQVAIDSSFNSVVASSMADAVNKTTITFSGLALNTQHYARVRYRSNQNATGDWSATIAFTIGNTTAVAFSEVAKMAGGDMAAGNRNGYSVALSAAGDRIAIGAPNNAASSIVNAGAIYIFKRVDGAWTQEAKLEAADKTTGSFLGRAVAMSDAGDRIVATAPGNNSGAAGKGSAYVFVRNTSTNAWTQEAKLIASDGIANEAFGDDRSVAMDRDGVRVIVGVSASRPSNLTGAGAAYVFARNTSTNAWTQESKLTASTPVAGQLFGCAVDIDSDGQSVIIGAMGTTTTETDYGEALFTSPGTTVWTVPNGVTSISLLGIAAGAGSSISQAGSGGGAAYKNNIPVTPGQQFTIKVAESSVAGGNGATTTIVGPGVNITIPGGKASGFGSELPTGGDGNFASIPGSSNQPITGNGIYLGSGGGASWTNTTANLPSFQATGGAAMGPCNVGGTQYTASYGSSANGSQFNLSGSNAPSTVFPYLSVYGSGGSCYNNGGTCEAVGGYQGAVRIVWGSGKTYPTNAWTTTAQGAAHTFTRSGTNWTLSRSILPPVNQTDGNFGASVTVSGDGTRIGIGAIGITSGNGLGLGYIYRNMSGNWIAEQTLQGSNRAANDRMGVSMAMNQTGDVIVIGEYNTTVSSSSGAGAGYAYARVNQTWSLNGKIVASDPFTNAQFGYCVDVSDDGLRLAIGAPGAVWGGSTAFGGAYIER